MEDKLIDEVTICLFFSIRVDESKDGALKSLLIIYVTYLENDSIG